MTRTVNPRREHEALAASASRWRRLQNGEPTAAHVLDTWRAKQAKRKPLCQPFELNPKP